MCEFIILVKSNQILTTSVYYILSLFYDSYKARIHIIKRDAHISLIWFPRVICDAALISPPWTQSINLLININHNKETHKQYMTL